MMNHSIGSTPEHARAENGPVDLCMNSSWNIIYNDVHKIIIKRSDGG
jgi:hypothetical protein